MAITNDIIFGAILGSGLAIVVFFAFLRLIRSRKDCTGCPSQRENGECGSADGLAKHLESIRAAKACNSK